MTYSALCDRCIAYSDILMKTANVDKFNHLPPESRAFFQGYFFKLLALYGVEQCTNHEDIEDVAVELPLGTFTERPQWDPQAEWANVVIPKIPQIDPGIYQSNPCPPEAQIYTPSTLYEQPSKWYEKYAKQDKEMADEMETITERDPRVDNMYSYEEYLEKAKITRHLTKKMANPPLSEKTKDENVE